MLDTTEMSRATKTNGCAVTYRAGSGSCFATCPSSCKLNTNPEQSTETVDVEYFAALLKAVPEEGVAFTYTHFEDKLWLDQYRAAIATDKPTTTVNLSCDTIKEAAQAKLKGIDVVIMTSHDDMRKTFVEDGLKVVRCPATEPDSELDCSTCGGGQPLCARKDRTYAIAFPGHGPSKKKVGNADAQGGCYAAVGNVRLHWNRLAKKVEDTIADGEKLLQFTRKLKRHTVLRHHIAGDIG